MVFQSLEYFNSFYDFALFENLEKRVVGEVLRKSSEEAVSVSADPHISL